MTSIRRFSAVLAAILVFALLLAGPAGAHTGFESSDPGDGAVIERAVDAITLVYTGAAEPTADGFQVLAPDGRVLEPVQAVSTDGRTWVLRFDPPLVDGTVGVRWSVKAPDAHPIEGSFSFTTTADATAVGPVSTAAAEPQDSVTAPSRTAGAAATAAAAPTQLDAFLETSGSRDAGAKRMGMVGRLLSYAGALVGIGALVFLAAVLRGGADDIRFVVHWVRRSGLVVMLGAGVELIAQLGVETAGNWATAWYPSTIASVVWGSFGIAVALRVLGGWGLLAGTAMAIDAAHRAADPVVAVRAFAGVGAGSRSDDAPWTRPTGSPPVTIPPTRDERFAWFADAESVMAFAGAALLVLAHGFDGHTVTQGSRVVTSAAAMAHVGGAAMWAGGVVMLAAVLWRRHRDDRSLDALSLAMRFSVVATVALVVVSVAGLALSVIVLDSVSEVWSTSWGRLLVLKSLVVGAVGFAGAYNHKVLIPEMEAQPRGRQITDRFRLLVTLEALGLVAVIALTAALVGAAS